MIKKYLMAASVLLVFFMFVSTSSASFLLSKGKIYERLSENSVFKKIVDRFSQIVSNIDNSMVTDIDENDGEDGLLPETIDVVGEKTLHEGNYIDVNNSDDTPTINVTGKDGTMQNVVTVDGAAGANNEMTTENDSKGGRTILERFVNVIIDHDGKLGATLQRVIERTYAPGTTASGGIAENIVDGVVVVGSGGTTVENTKADVVVITNSDH